MKNTATTNAKAIQMRQEIADGYKLPDTFNWQNPCPDCQGKGNVKNGCCGQGECGGCDGFGVKNLGEEEVEPID